jgi:DNA polymerase elongation subunit (family B)
MKIPLIGITSPNTINLETGEQQAILYVNGKRRVVKTPYEPYCYVPDENGKQYRLTGQKGLMNLRKQPYRAGEELPKSVIIDGGREQVMDRLVIEHPDFFYQYANTEPVRSLCFDIETHSPDGRFPFGENYPVVAIGIVTSTGEREVFLWDGESDRDVLKNFAVFIQEYDPDIIYGYNLIGYDIPQILFRANFHGMRNYKKLLNRDGSNYGWAQPKESKDLRCKVGGRIIFDVLRYTRRDYALSGMPRGLKAVSRHFGLEPIELDFGDKVLLDYSLSEIHDYVLSDVDSTKYLFEHYYPQVEFTAELLGVPLETYINSPNAYVTKVLQGRSLFEQEIVTPDINKDRHPAIYKADHGNFQAAHIDLFEPGYHEKNYKLDFSSFYPSIAMALNLGPDTTRIVGYEAYKPELEFRDNLIYVPDNKVDKRLIIEVDTDRKSSLYQMSRSFKEMRAPYKGQVTKEAISKSNALKIMVNTFYGANTNPYINYGDMAVGITITAVARSLLVDGINLIRKKYGDKSVVYCHTDGINTNIDVDVLWLTKRLRLILENKIPFADSQWIEMDKDVYKEGFWVQIGNYVLRNEDGSLTKHGSTFKASTRSVFYKNTLNKIIEGRLANKINQTFIDSIYEFEHVELEDFLQRRNLNRPLDQYVSETDMLIGLAEQGKSIGIEPLEGTTYRYYKTGSGYTIQELVKDKSKLDVRYYWDIISKLLRKFQLDVWVKKKVPITIIDKKQKSLMEWI